MTIALIAGAVAGFCGGCMALAVWDILRRAFNTQVRLAELRVEILRREEYDDLVERFEVLRGQLQAVQQTAESNTAGLGMREMMRR